MREVDMVKLNTWTILAAFIGCIVSSKTARADDAKKNDSPDFIQAFHSIEKDTEDKLKPVYERAAKDFDAAKTDADRERLMENIRAEGDRIMAPATKKTFELVKPNASDPAAVEPLVWIVEHCHNSDTGSDAAGLLMKYHLVRRRQ